MYMVPQSNHLRVILHSWQTEKRDALRAIEEKYQKLWQEEKVFESNAPPCSEYPLGTVPVDELWLKAPKFFGESLTPSVPLSVSQNADLV
jgi:hypothetical protein